MTALELVAIRLRFAGYDMTKARKENGIIITGTAQGNVALDFDASTKLYKVANINTGALLFEGKAGEARVFVAGLYIINEG